MIETNDYSKIASVYSKSPIRGTGYLAFRDIPQIIQKYYKNNQPNIALDFGCGTGRSSRYLHSLGINKVYGVDKSQEMLDHAIINNDDINYLFIKDNYLPFESDYFDLVFSTFVMLEIATKTELLNIFTNIYNVLKPDSYFIFVTNSEHLYSKNWLTNSTNYPKDKIFKNGEKIKIFLKNINQELYDYYWDDEAYKSILNQAGFNYINVHYPLGHTNEPYEWLDEAIYSPFAVYTVKK